MVAAVGKGGTVILFLVLLLVLFWAVGGVGLHLGGDLIHILLVVALICLIVNFWPRLRGGGDV